MNNPIVDTRDLRYILFEVLNIDSLINFELFSSFDHDTFEATLNLIEDIAVKECLPYFAAADKDGCKWDPATGEVTVPEGVRKPLKAYYDAELIGMYESPSIGGTGMPQSLGAAYIEFISAAHQPLLMWGALAHGSMMLIARFGTEEQKKTFIP
ncbi:MAG TPA: acyl-CoA dehydrogenase family protein, partial [Spirochaetota bacterium]|nr:acyl-CoA dehydrogenase family protein [Spirochaetota bacterium]